MEKALEKRLGDLEKRIQEWMLEAFQKGYDNGYADASRRMEFMYKSGVSRGIEDAMTYVGAISIEEIEEVPES